MCLTGLLQHPRPFLSHALGASLAQHPANHLNPDESFNLPQSLIALHAPSRGSSYKIQIPNFLLGSASHDSPKSSHARPRTPDTSGSQVALDAPAQKPFRAQRLHSMIRIHELLKFARNVSVCSSKQPQHPTPKNNAAMTSHRGHYPNLTAPVYRGITNVHSRA